MWVLVMVMSVGFEVPINSLYASNIVIYNPMISILQTEEQEEKKGAGATIGDNKPSVGSFLVEFAGASILEILPTSYLVFSYLYEVMNCSGRSGFSKITNAIPIYIAGSTLLCPIGVWLTGSLLKQKGSFKKSLIGAGIGSILGVVVCNTLLTEIAPERSALMYSLSSLFLLPPLGATIGYNWK